MTLLRRNQKLLHRLPMTQPLRAVLCAYATWRKANAAAVCRACTCSTRTASTTGSSETVLGKLCPCYTYSSRQHLSMFRPIVRYVHRCRLVGFRCTALGGAPRRLTLLPGWQPCVQNRHSDRSSGDEKGGRPAAVLCCGHAWRARFPASRMGRRGHGRCDGQPWHDGR